MSLFVISDLHLSLSTNKSMDIFYGWDNYVERLKSNWCRVVSDDDTVVIPGDISWALKLEDATEDFRYIDSLPGKKVILKGNHDLWWSTIKKLNEFFTENKINTITPIFNSSLVVEDKCICGSRGWFFDKPEADKKIILREAGRLDVSITSAKSSGVEPIVFLHYPPVYADSYCKEIFDVLKKHKISKVYHGHIHGSGLNNVVKFFDGIEFKLVSADCIDFTPYKI